MKRTIITIIAAAVAMAAVSCNKETGNPQAPRGETLDISVSALMPEYSEGV
ncbi:MAG: hypothetical protein KBS58_06760 [Bacteroidales bacterium]|nr:hypothetical protein [Candidatus Cacconaster equi]